MENTKMDSNNSPKPDTPLKNGKDVQNVMENTVQSVSWKSSRNKVTEEMEVKHTVEDMLQHLEETNMPISYQDQVLEYLKNQEQYAGEDVDLHDIMTQDQIEVIEETTRIILKQLLMDVSNITAFKEAYARKKVLNNQFDLFDLATKVKDFHISDKVMETLAFRETLIISKVNEKGQTEPVGGLCLDVQTALGAKWEKQKKFPDFTKALLNACTDMKKKYMKDATEEIKKDLEEYTKFLEQEMTKQYKKFLIHASSQFNVNGNNAGSRMTAWVDRNLHTLEEKRTEYIEKYDRNDNKAIDQKKIHIYMGKKHFDVRVDPGGDCCQKYCYSFRRASDLVGEAANFLLMRYLAIVKFIGEFELSAVHIDGALCRNIYQCDGPLGGFINNQRMDLYKVYRTVIEECGITQRSCTILSLDGRIMKHDWEKCDYVLQINPLLCPRKKKPTLILHFNEAWKYDLQLLSRYLDKKVAATYLMKSYLRDHREIGNLINDFVQNILQIKPENIIEFTKHHFLSYAPYLIPRAEYFEKELNRSFDDDE